MTSGYLWSGIVVMAIITYIIRCTPMILFRKRIKSKFIQSFLYYVPYSVLTAMTIPAVFTSTGSVIGAVSGCVIAVILSYYKKSLLTVAIAASFVAFIVQYLGF